MTIACREQSPISASAGDISATLSLSSVDALGLIGRLLKRRDAYVLTIPTDAKVVVLGSLVFDIAIEIDRVPDVHETVLAESATISAGGKGLCQAIAARRLGVGASAIGLVGRDVFGDYLLDVLQAEDIAHEHVRRSDSGTHIGIPIITPDHNNRIIGVPRASFNLDPLDVERAEPVLAETHALLVQGESPLDAIHAGIRLCNPRAILVWNPAPARFTLEQMLNESLRGRAIWLTPNEAEAAELSAVAVHDPESGLVAARAIRSRFDFVGVVVTLGDQGAVAIDPQGSEYVAQPFHAAAVDPTAAGDTFSAAFAVALVAGSAVDTALSFACAAGALTTERIGAVRSIPTYADVVKLVNEMDV